MPFTSSSCRPQNSAICRKVSVVFSTSQTAVAFCISGSAMADSFRRTSLSRRRKLGCAGARRSVFAGELPGYIVRMRGMIKWFSPLGARPRSSPRPRRGRRTSTTTCSRSPGRRAGAPPRATPATEQCDPDRDLGFTLHGLWPQYEEGWPEDCDSDAGRPLAPRDRRHGRHHGLGRPRLVPVEEARPLRRPARRATTSRSPAASTARSTCRARTTGAPPPPRSRRRSSRPNPALGARRRDRDLPRRPDRRRCASA